MKITEALRVDKQNAIAIVGAGGKTSLMFSLAACASRPVCLTTTTKIAREEGSRAANHILFVDFSLSSIDQLRLEKLTLVTNGLNPSGDKWLGLSYPEISQLFQNCQQGDTLLIIEADGARRLPLKAPAEYEPVIPDWVSLVIVVVGLSAIGKTLDEEHVFRPERFSEVSGLALGELVRLEHILKMLTHPDGGLKEIPSGCKAIIVFNQSDVYDVDSLEIDLIKAALRGKYISALLMSLRSDPGEAIVIFRE